MDLTEAEDIKKRWQEYTELYKTDLHDPDNHNGMITHLELDILECEVKWNLLDLLPEVFTREEAQLMRHRQGIEEGSVRSMLSNWKKRGYIEVYGNVLPQNEASRQQYIKTPAYLEKHPQAA